MHRFSFSCGTRRHLMKKKENQRNEQADNPHHGELGAHGMRLQFHLDAFTVSQLSYLKDYYASHLGFPASASAIVRRAVAVLTDQVARLVAGRGRRKDTEKLTDAETTEALLIARLLKSREAPAKEIRATSPAGRPLTWTEAVNTTAHRRQKR